MAGTDPLLRTKLRPPCRRETLIPRPRLNDLLRTGLHPGRRLILISAPPGYGKTTMVAAWLEGMGLGRTPWLSLEESENDPAQFLAYLGAALETAAPDFRRFVSSLAGAPRMPAAESVAAELIDSIVPGPSPLLLVLDDYHVITNPYVHSLVRFLLLHQPLHLRLVIAGREDPPFPLTRLRAHGGLVEVRAADLRFSGEEAAAFFRAMGLTPRDGAAAAWAERTEGWAAGLQLAALGLQNRGPLEAEAFLAAFGGGHRYVLDYLADEVLDRLEASLREFLRRTAVLDRFTPALCDAVTGRSDSREVLRRLEAANLFLVPLDDEREWYRYHHLFADALRAELDGGERAAVHAGAARWFEEAGDLPAAVKHALAAGKHGEAARLIAAAVPEMFLRGQLVTLGDWLAVLPEEIIRKSEDLVVAKAWTFYLTGRIHEAEAYLAGWPANARAGMSAYNQGRIVSLEALIAGYRSDDARAADLARKALASIPGEIDPVARASTLNTLGQALHRLGDLDAAEAAFREAENLAAAFPGSFITVVTVVYLCYLLDLRGRRREAEAICRRRYRSLLDATGRPPPLAGMLAVRLGVMAYEAGELAEAHSLLETGLELCRRLSIHRHLQAEETLALTLNALGEREAAMDVLHGAERSDASEDARFANAAVAAELKRRRGDSAAVESWVEEWRLAPDALPDMEREPGYLTYARHLLDRRRPEAALTLLRGMARQIEAGGRRSRLIPVRVLEALALRALGKTAEAAARFAQAVSMAAPEGYLRAFLDQGPEVAALLPGARDAAPAFVDRISAAYKTAGGRRSASLPEPLTERELDLLPLLAEGLSNEEISRRLYISLNTTKWHLKSIFGKLGVENRTQAAAKARKMGLI